jgi:hypothetical protein
VTIVLTGDDALGYFDIGDSFARGSAATSAAES